MADTNIVELAYAHWRADEEKEIEYRIVKAREYHDGEQFVYLTTRLREFLNVDEDAEFNLNIARGIVEAITEKLRVKAFKCADAASSDFAWQVWTANKMDARQVDVHDAACRDSETFVIVDYDAESNTISLLPHKRYTDAECDGDNEGCKAFYQNDDPNQKLLRVSKRWVETVGGKSRTRLTVYHPDKIEKYELVNGNFVQIDEEIMTEEGDEAWPIEWVDKAGKPLGIPVIHFKNHGLRQEARDAWPLQDAANKTLVDLLAASDMTGFRIYTAFGWNPTKDTLEPKPDGSNLLSVSPGAIFGSKNDKGTFSSIEGSSPEPLISTLQQLIYYAAIVTRTPVSRFQFSGQVAAEGTLKQQQESLLAKIALRQTSFGDCWAQAMTMARKLFDTFGGGSLDETQAIETMWESAETRDRLQELQALQIEKDALNVPLTMLWRKAGYSEQDIEQMMQQREDEMLMNLRVSQSDLSTPFVNQGGPDVTQPE
jgi:hypothetical protein